jgi:hypothetical protein
MGIVLAADKRHQQAPSSRSGARWQHGRMRWREREAKTTVAMLDERSVVRIVIKYLFRKQRAIQVRES